MDYRFEEVTRDVHVLSMWDEISRSYVNSYVLLWEGDVILVDAGKEEHADALLDALSLLGKERSDVTAILATHGHLNHVGGSSAFPNAAKLIHEYDWPRLPSKLHRHFAPTLPGEGSVLDFDCVLLGYHTTGSVALFHRPTRTLFIGDHINFEEEPVRGKNAVEEEVLREQARRFVQRINNPRNRLKERAELFRAGTSSLGTFEAEFLCPGHGGVLTRDISAFLSELLTVDGR